MNSIRIEDGSVRLCVNEDEGRQIVFNPNDLRFMDRLYEMFRYFDGVQSEYQRRMDEIAKDETVDGFGIPSGMKARLTLLQEVCEDMKQRIDSLFGEGTSQAAFGELMTLDMFEQFFDGITPYVEKASTARVERYTKPAKRKKAVMR